MTNLYDTDALVVGAGPTGLLLASELLRRGLACKLIDALDRPSPRSRALAIHARTLELFEQIGIIDEVLELGWKSQAFTVFDRKKQLVRMLFDELDSPFPYLVSLPQWHTERILAQLVRTNGGVVDWNTTLIDFEQFPEKVVATIKTPDGDEIVSCRWLIGCDGAHSKVRKILNIDFPGVPYWEQYVLADVNFEATLDLGDHYIFSGSAGVAGFHPFAADSARIFADLGRIRRPRGVTNQLPEAREAFPEPTQQELQTILDSRGPGKVKLVSINWQSMHTIHRRVVQSYRHGRVLLAGDAAHIHSPTGGQGMNLGLQDAANLAWKLALVEKKLAHDSLLDSYSTERRLICRRVSAMSDFFSRINNVRSPISQAVRNVLGPFLAEKSNIRRDYRNAVSQISLNYRESPIVSESVERSSAINPINTPKAGDRAPDAVTRSFETNNAVRVFDIIKSPEHHILLFLGPLSNADDARSLVDIASLVETRWGALVKAHVFMQSEASLDVCGPDSLKKYLDDDLSAHGKYGANAACLFLVRPDGYIGFRGLPPSKTALDRYLTTIFL